MPCQKAEEECNVCNSGDCMNLNGDEAPVDLSEE
jgi:hypothetical protein